MDKLDQNTLFTFAEIYVEAEKIDLNNKEDLRQFLNYIHLFIKKFDVPKVNTIKFGYSGVGPSMTIENGKLEK